MNINVGSWNVGGIGDYEAQIGRTNSQVKETNTSSLETNKNFEELKSERTKTVVTIIKEKLKESPIICLQEVDKDIYKALQDEGVGIVWDNFDAAIAFDKDKVENYQQKAASKSLKDSLLILDFSIDGKLIRVASQHLSSNDPFKSDSEDIFFNKKQEKVLPDKTKGLHQFIELTNKLDELNELQKADMEIIGIDANVTMKQDDGNLPLRLQHAKDKNFKFDKKADDATVWNAYFDKNSVTDKIYHRCDYIMVRVDGKAKPMIKEFGEKFDLSKPDVSINPSDHTPIQASIKFPHSAKQTMKVKASDIYSRLENVFLGTLQAIKEKAGIDKNSQDFNKIRKNFDSLNYTKHNLLLENLKNGGFAGFDYPPLEYSQTQIEGLKRILDDLNNFKNQTDDKFTSRIDKLKNKIQDEINLAKNSLPKSSDG